MKLLTIGNSIRYIEHRGAEHPVYGQGVVAFIRTGYWHYDTGTDNIVALEYPDGDSRITLTNGTIIRGDQITEILNF